MKFKCEYYVISSLFFLFNPALNASTGTAGAISSLPALYKTMALGMSINLHEEDRIIEHIRESTDKHVNPVVLAIQKNDIELAELLLTIRRIELSLGIDTFSFPGYLFNRPYGELGEEAVVWMKRHQINLLNDQYFYEAKVDVEILRLLMKYDDKNLWTSEIRKIFSHAYQRCDLDGVLFCLQLSLDDLTLVIGDAISKPLFLVDPFLSEFPINLDDHSHFYDSSNWTSTPCIWDCRPDDNVIVKEIKNRIQQIIFGHPLVDEKTNEINALRRELEEIKTQRHEESKEFNRKIEALKEMLSEDYKNEVDALRKELESIKVKQREESEEFKKRNEELHKNQLDSRELERILITYGNNPDGMSTLHYAIKKGDANSVRLLIAAGADINSKDGNCTALIRAVSCNQFEITRILLDSGADINCLGHINHNVEPKLNALYYAAQLGKSDIITLLIRKGANVNHNYVGIGPVHTPLHVAAQAGNYEAVVALVNGGAQIDGNLPTNIGANHWTNGTPLDWAAFNLKYADNPQNLELIKFLVQKGATRRCRNYHACPVIEGYLKSVGQ